MRYKQHSSTSHDERDVKDAPKDIKKSTSTSSGTKPATSGVVYGALTSGVGFLTGIGAHAASGAAHILDADDGKSLLLGSVSFHEAEQWENARFRLSYP